MPDKIDSNVSGLSIAEELSLKVLPVTPVWYEMEPNAYSDFGAELSTVARNPINTSRQRKRGVITDINASGGFNSDLTQTNLVRQLQGFFFADAREKPATQPLNAAAVAFTSVVGAPTNEYRAAAGLAVFLTGHLVKVSGFTNSGNNGLKLLSTVAPGALGVSTALVAEAAPPAAAKIEAVGFQCGSGDISATVAGGLLTLASVVLDFTTLGLTPGEWVFIGGDTAGTKFATCPSGYARIYSIAAHALVFDETTFAAVDDAGAAKTLQLFFGTVLRNEKDEALIKRRSYQLERKLGNDGDGVQSEYIIGAFPNEFNITIPQADKITVDLSYVACDSEYRNGATGVKTGTRVASPAEDAFNTSSDIYRMKMAVVDPTTLTPTALFGYVSELNVSINNQITPNKAIGVIGAFDATAGDFEVGGSVTAYFSSIAACAALRANSDVAFSIIAAQKNGGFVLDMPLTSLGGGRITVEKDNPITIPLENSAAECPKGYTLLSCWFNYLPDAAMPAN